MSPDSIFHHTYVISLPHKKERQAQITKELERMNISNWSFFKAADGKKSDIRDIALRLQILDSDTLPFFSPGHLGCLVSHYTLWLQIYLSNLSDPSDRWHFILEDDARFHPSMTSDKFVEIWKDLPPDAIFAKFHSSNGYKDLTALYSEPASQFWLRQTKPTFSLMAYAVRTSALKTLLMTKWRNHIDLFHIEHTYIAKRPDLSDPSELFVSTLYTEEGLFSQGICIPNNSQDSDTIDGEIETGKTPLYKLKQVMDGQTYKEGEMTIHLYDEPTATGICHVLFGFNQKRFTYTD